MTERFYWAQCVKDETMAESIVAALEKSPGRQAADLSSLQRRVPQRLRPRHRRARPPPRCQRAESSVVSMLPVADLDTLTPAGEDLKRADYLVYTTK